MSLNFKKIMFSITCCIYLTIPLLAILNLLLHYRGLHLTKFSRVTVYGIYRNLTANLAENLQISGNVHSEEVTLVPTIGPWTPNFLYVTDKNITTIYNPDSSIRHINLYDPRKTHCNSSNPLPFLFLKTHKCGSTLIQILFNKYFKRHPNANRRHSLIGPWIGGYPNKFLAKYAPPIGKPASITNHMRFNSDNDLAEYKKAFGQDKFYRIGIIRQPLTQWFSSYNFYNRGPSKTNQSLGCMNEPWNQVYHHLNLLANENEEFNVQNMPANELLSFLAKNPDSKSLTNNVTNYLRNSFFGFRSLNSMSFDFGLDWKNDNLSEQTIEKVVNQFDVIIILERLPESFILIKNLLCMEFEDIILNEMVTCGRCHSNIGIGVDSNYVSDQITYEKITQNANLTKYGITDLAEQKLYMEILEKHFIKNDIKLYNAVGKKFQLDIEKFGHQNMRSELNIYRNLIAASNKEELTEEEIKAGITRRKRRSSEDLSIPYYQKLVRYMIEGQGYCGYFDKIFGEQNVTNVVN